VALLFWLPLSCTGVVSHRSSGLHGFRRRDECQCQWLKKSRSHELQEEAPKSTLNVKERETISNDLGYLAQNQMRAGSRCNNFFDYSKGLSSQSVMLIRCRLFLSVFLFVIGFGAGAALAQGPGYGPPPGYRPEYPGYYHEHHERHIVRALYGTRSRYADVTEIVRRFASDGIRFEVSNETFGVDPYKGKGKHLRVIMVDHEGVEFERSWDEGDSVRL
jgi:hypothetical protein